MPPPLIANSVMLPCVVIRPIFPNSVNHSALSGPSVIADGRLAGVGRVNSVNVWAATGQGPAAAHNPSVIAGNSEAIAILMASFRVGGLAPKHDLMNPKGKV